MKVLAIGRLIENFAKFLSPIKSLPATLAVSKVKEKIQKVRQSGSLFGLTKRRSRCKGVKVSQQGPSPTRSKKAKKKGLEDSSRTVRDFGRSEGEKWRQTGHGRA
jgi:hypothetical protein